MDGLKAQHLMGRRAGVFAWTPLARILRMSHELDFDLEPGGLALLLASPLLQPLLNTRFFPLVSGLVVVASFQTLR